MHVKDTSSAGADEEATLYANCRYSEFDCTSNIQCIVRDRDAVAYNIERLFEVISW